MNSRETLIELFHRCLVDVLSIAKVPMTTSDQGVWRLPELEMNVSVLKTVVEGLLSRTIARSTFFRWRQELNFTSPPYCRDHAIALMLYGNYLGCGLPPGDAKTRTIQKLEEFKSYGCY